ncbi:uncharacterized protein THITE_2117393 [Thermothielavioides terrestris NRRL 8126]|uniref:Uncharacterized protein n=1 Tax=Thermothielavioides terrestris (strain ATCC 38088 / NRRL 8126) TaxID=578455 RepID=G2R805_THETT|nr:uncharacterized protein THITE_2117393 [Thermothielavioides terrestris NRRL 8126]AEO68064.1 hypothetical protein THITE_2117393 [Thermothielavioides terrestris NRRL 8126]
MAMAMALCCLGGDRQKVSCSLGMAFGLANHDAVVVAGLVKLAGLAWWKPMWTVQEIALARRLWCGRNGGLRQRHESHDSRVLATESPDRPGPRAPKLVLEKPGQRVPFITGTRSASFLHRIMDGEMIDAVTRERSRGNPCDFLERLVGSVMAFQTFGLALHCFEGLHNLGTRSEGGIVKRPIDPDIQRVTLPASWDMLVSANGIAVCLQASEAHDGATSPEVAEVLQAVLFSPKVAKDGDAGRMRGPFLHQHGKLGLISGSLPRHRSQRVLHLGLGKGL